MKYRLIVQIASIVLIIVLPLFMFISCGCNSGFSDRGVYINIDNNTDIPIIIYIEGIRHGKVLPGEKREIATLTIYPENVYPSGQKFLFEAKMETEELIYSNSYTWQELDDMEWNITIPLLTKNFFYNESNSL